MFLSLYIYWPDVYTGQPLRSNVNSAAVLLSYSTNSSTPLHRECTRGGFCNFMHLKPISRELRRELYGRRRKRYCWFTSVSDSKAHIHKV